MVIFEKFSNSKLGKKKEEKGSNSELEDSLIKIVDFEIDEDMEEFIDDIKDKLM